MVKRGTGPDDIITDGMVSTAECMNYLVNTPPSSKIGKQGWPCFRGGGTAFTATIEESGQDLHGMVFYRPESVRDYSELDITQRRPRYEKAVKYCMDEEEAKEVTNVSQFAVCIKENYPHLQRVGRNLSFAVLRANVAFTNFKRSGVDREAALSSSDGGVWIDCTRHTSLRRVHWWRL